MLLTYTNDSDIQEDYRKPTSLIHVVDGGRLAFFVQPGERWVLQSDSKVVYEITIQPYDIDDNRIHMSDNMRMKASFPKDFFEIVYSSKNGTYHQVKALKPGLPLLHAKLQSIELEVSFILKLNYSQKSFCDVNYSS